MGRIFLGCGGLLGASGVAMAAVAAHALRSLDAAALEAVRSAVQMQVWHALALSLAGLWVMRAPKLAHRLAGIAGTGFCVGTLLFCGAIYAHHLLGLSPGPLAPVGGVTLILSWLVFGASAIAAGPTP
jgi:uncharacterized membrane protein YgdD (TMEM256/DUF423 family)